MAAERDINGNEPTMEILKYQKEGDQVKVVFNVQTNEWKDKYFTSLSAWRIEKISGETTATETEEEGDDLPF